MRAASVSIKSISAFEIFFRIPRSRFVEAEVLSRAAVEQCQVVERMRPDLSARFGVAFPALDVPTPWPPAGAQILPSRFRKMVRWQETEHVMNLLTATFLTAAIVTAADPITPGMRAALARIDTAHAGMDRETIDDALEDLHRELAKQDPKVFAPLVVHHLMRLAPQDTQTRVLLRKALAEKWLEELPARALLVRAGDTPGPHVEVLLKALDAPDAKTRRTAIREVEGLGVQGRAVRPKVKKTIEDAKADPSDFLRAFRTVDAAPDHVLAYWAGLRIEAELKARVRSESRERAPPADASSEQTPAQWPGFCSTSVATNGGSFSFRGVRVSVSGSTSKFVSSVTTRSFRSTIDRVLFPSQLPALYVPPAPTRSGSPGRVSFHVSVPSVTFNPVMRIAVPSRLGTLVVMASSRAVPVSLLVLTRSTISSRYAPVPLRSRPGRVRLPSLPRSYRVSLLTVVASNVKPCSDPEKLLNVVWSSVSASIRSSSSLTAVFGSSSS